jgi:hypothetical protein
MTTETLNTLEATREDLYFALGECIAAAPPEKQIALGIALEEFAATRGRAKYNRILNRTLILADLLGTIEECTDAQLFIEK